MIGTTGKASSLWQCNGSSWKNVVTQEIVYVKPKECKGALLADDMGLGKTLVRPILHSAFRSLMSLRKRFAFLHTPLTKHKSSAPSPSKHLCPRSLFPLIPAWNTSPMLFGICQT